MIITTKEQIISHLQDDLKIESNALIWMHSGVIGLGLIKNMVSVITEAFQSVLNSGTLVIPSFSYSWCMGKKYDYLKTESVDVGAYAEDAWKQDCFARNMNPNFSISLMDRTANKKVKSLLCDDSTKFTCFGQNSVFDKMYQLSKDIPSYILLFGGAHSDVVFRSTFLHFVEEKIGVPYRYTKFFYNPNNSEEITSQYVRYLSSEEYVSVNKSEPPGQYKFPIQESYRALGQDLQLEGLLRKVKIGYSETRVVSIYDFCNWLTTKIENESEYLLR